MEAQTRPLRRLASRLVLLAVGVALGATLVAAHFTGRLTPVYHSLGLHWLHDGSNQSEDGKESPPGGAHAGHAGHGGMSMPQTDRGEPSSIPGYSIVKITSDRQQLIGVRPRSRSHWPGKGCCLPALPLPRGGRQGAAWQPRGAWRAESLPRDRRRLHGRGQPGDARGSRL